MAGKRKKANPLIFWVAGGILVFGFTYTYIRRRNAALALAQLQSPTPNSIDSNNIVSLASTNVNDYENSIYLQDLMTVQQLSQELTYRADLRAVPSPIVPVTVPPSPNFNSGSTVLRPI